MQGGNVDLFMYIIMVQRIRRPTAAMAAAMVVVAAVKTSAIYHGTCTTDAECSLKMRTQAPYSHSLCTCYVTSSVNPFNECEGTLALEMGSFAVLDDATLTELRKMRMNT